MLFQLGNEIKLLANTTCSLVMNQN